MTHGSGITIAVAATAVLLAITPGPSAQATTDTSATITDGCGRVDRVEADGSGPFYIEALPDGKAVKQTDPATAEEIAAILALPRAQRSAEQWALLNGYTPMPASGWQRPMDASKKYLQVRVLTYAEDGRFEPVPLTLSGADATTGVLGTESFRITNDDCVVPAEPTFTDEVGSEKDTVTIPQLQGVKYSGKPGVSAGTGTVTVTATPEAGYRFADPDGVPIPPDQTRWSYTFDGTAPIEVPEDKAPAFRLGEAIPATASKPATRGDNIVVVKNVPGVTWIVDGKPQKTSDKALTVEVKVGAKTSVEVQAVSADPKAFVLTGTTEWTVGAGATTSVKPTLPTVTASTETLQLGASTVAWAPPRGFPAASTYNVRYRVITLTPNAVRATAPWRAWLQETKKRSAVLKAKPGTVVELQTQAVAGTRISGWSTPTTVWYPTDVRTAPGKTWKMIKQNGALGGTMAVTPQRTSAWTVKTPTTNRVMIWFGTSPTGAPASVYVDGRKVATVSTRDKHTKVRQVLKPIPVSWGKHVVTVVHTGSNGTTLRVDGIAYGR